MLLAITTEAGAAAATYPSESSQRGGELAEVVLRDAADVDLILRTFHRARFEGSRLLVARAITQRASS